MAQLLEVFAAKFLFELGKVGGNDVLDALEGISLIKNREIASQLQARRLLFEDDASQRMKGANGQLRGGLLIDLARDTLAHFGGRLVGKGHGQNLTGLRQVIAQQVDNLGDDDTGLA